jgi:hypothetical protein
MTLPDEFMKGVLRLESNPTNDVEQEHDSVNGGDE